MQVRKYEASTIKEAVDLVKQDLGPDAIILSTREMEKRMAGESKVVITAAVNESLYQKKIMVEKNITDAEKESLSKKPVRVQRQFIEQIYENLQSNIVKKRRKINQVNYASIKDEDFLEDEVIQEPVVKKFKDKGVDVKRARSTPRASAKTKKSQEKRSAEAISVAQRRVRSAAEAAAKISKDKELDSNISVAAEVGRIDELKGEINRLQDMLKSLSQTSMNHKTGFIEKKQDELAPMHERLTKFGFEKKVATQLIEQAKQKLGSDFQNKNLLDAWLAKWVMSTVKHVANPLDRRFHFFVGPRGGGKTSSLVKMASHLVIKERRKVAIITSDTNKVGATEQLRIYSQILNIPFAVWRKGQDLGAFLQQLGAVDHILFDNPGCSLLKTNEMDDLKSFLPQELGDARIHLVLSSMLKDEELYSVARRFKMINYDDVILTNLDQLHKHGLLVNLYLQSQAPYFALSNGPMVPEDFEWASKERILDYIFKISNSRQTGGSNGK